MGLSFFYKPAFWLGGHWQRVSSLIRGTQIADYLGARHNPTADYADDVCIYVKPHIKRQVTTFDFAGPRPCLDLIDGWDLRHILGCYPQVTALACTQHSANLLRRLRWLRNPVVFIPQHHCNFERAARTRQGVQTVGVIGSWGAYPLIPAALKDAVRERGLEWYECPTFTTRQDVVDFYQRIDVQVVWRPIRRSTRPVLTPLKLVNAASFGIPTIALEEGPLRVEWGGDYLAVESVAEALAALDRLRGSLDLYAELAERGRAHAEAYHIERVAGLYRALEAL